MGGSNKNVEGKPCGLESDSHICLKRDTPPKKEGAVSLSVSHPKKGSLTKASAALTELEMLGRCHFVAQVTRAVICSSGTSMRLSTRQADSCFLGMRACKTKPNRPEVRTLGFPFLVHVSSDFWVPQRHSCTARRAVGQRSPRCLAFRRIPEPLGTGGHFCLSIPEWQGHCDGDLLVFSTQLGCWPSFYLLAGQESRFGAENQGSTPSRELHIVAPTKHEPRP